MSVKNMHGSDFDSKNAPFFIISSVITDGPKTCTWDYEHSTSILSKAFQNVIPLNRRVFCL